MYRKICFYLDEVENIVFNRSQPPISVEIDPSNYCQNKCSFCLYKDYRKEDLVHINYSTYEQLIFDLKFMNVKSITFTGGGEPTMNPDFNKMIQLAYNEGFELGLITNGLKLRSIEHILDQFRFIRISIDAGSLEVYKKVKGRDFFQTLLKGIKYIKNYIPNKTTFGASFVVCEDNQDDIKNFKTVFEPYFDYLQIKPEIHNTNICTSNNGKTVTISERYNPTSLLPCHIAGLVGIIGANGEVYYCCQKRGDKNYSLGNIKNESFVDIWTKRNKIKPVISKCLPCRYMNYAIEYEKYKDPKFNYLRHKRFL